MRYEQIDLPPVDYLRECFEIDGGGLRWRVRPESHFHDRADWKRWKTRNAGKRAGSIQRVRNYTYARVKIGDVGYQVHRLVWAMTRGGTPPPGYVVRHRDGDGLNNSPGNLVLVSTENLTQFMRSFRGVACS